MSALGMDLAGGRNKTNLLLSRKQKGLTCSKKILKTRITGLRNDLSDHELDAATCVCCKAIP
jgi:hypothetical protein